MIAAEVEWLAVVVEDTVKRIANDQLKVVPAAAPGRLPDLVEDPGRGDHRRAAVDSVAIYIIDIGATAQLVPFFEQFHLMTACGQTRGDAQPAEPGANNDDSRHKCPPNQLSGTDNAPIPDVLRFETT